jgi:hypothetical protein
MKFFWEVEIDVRKPWENFGDFYNWRNSWFMGVKSCCTAAVLEKLNIAEATVFRSVIKAQVKGVLL